MLSIPLGRFIRSGFSINEDDCVGCGSCEAICPEVFKLDGKKGKSTVIKPEGGPEGLIEEAMEACPVSCISWKG